MTTHTVAQILTSIRQTIGRSVWWLGLSLVLMVAVVAASRATPVATVSAPAVRST